MRPEDSWLEDSWLEDGPLACIVLHVTQNCAFGAHRR